MRTTSLTIEPYMLFETSKGSKYYVGKKLRTQRNKSFHPEHGEDDTGWKEATDMAVFVPTAVAKEIAPKIFGSFWLCFHQGKLVLVSKLNGLVTPLKRIEYSSVPEKGLCPVEFWSFRNLGHDVFYISKRCQRLCLFSVFLFQL